MQFKEKTWYKCIAKYDSFFDKFHIMYVYSVVEDSQDDLDQHIFSSSENCRHDFCTKHQLLDFENIEITEKLAKKFIILWGYKWNV